MDKMTVIFLKNNNMVILIESEIHLRPFWVILDNINMKNIVKFEIGHVSRFNFVFL